MSDTKLYISQNNEQKGPYALKEILGLLESNELAPTDYVFDQSKDDWVLLMQFGPVTEALASAKPNIKPAEVKNEKLVEEADKLDDEKISKLEPKSSTKVAADDFMKFEWFILKGENKFGPFSYVDVIKMLQQGVVYEFDFVWYKGLDKWTRLAELKAFLPDHVRQLKDTLMPEISEVFFRRRHRRAEFGGTILIHDNKKVWKGQAVEISAGGAGVVMENSTIIPGQNLYLHFKPGDGVPPFNAICEVVSKQYVENIKDQAQAVRYGLKFKSISEEARKHIQEYTGIAKSA